MDIDEKVLILRTNMEDAMKSAMLKLADSYVKNPLIRALVQLLPYGSAFDVGLSTTLANIRADRARTFFDELEQTGLSLTEEQIKSEDFLHAYFATCKATLNTRRREKIKLFARLLHNYAANPTEFEEFEGNLSVLDDLSYREFQVLVILKQYEETNPHRQDDNELKRARRFWDDFLDTCAIKLKIPIEEINGMLTRLNRTGLYQTLVGAYLDYEGDIGRLTPNFYKFVQKLTAADTDQ